LQAVGASGWNAPPSEKWFEDVIEKSSQVKKNKENNVNKIF